jgi:transcriptional regulator with XRE-family HTH domain
MAKKSVPEQMQFVRKPHGNTRLSDSDVIAIRTKYRAGKTTLEDLAVRFHVTVSYVSRLTRNEARPQIDTGKGGL